MPALLDIQHAFACAMQSGDCATLAPLIAAGTIAPEEAIAIYRNTFISGATKALRLSYPAVERLTGEEFFNHAAARFIEVSPPDSGCLDDFGAAFAEFLADFGPAADLPYLPDVARLEWRVNLALHASDAAALDAEGFSAAAGIAPARLVLTPHPSLSLATCRYPADAIWRAVLNRDDAALGALSLKGGPFFLLVARDSGGVAVDRIGEDAWHFLSAVCAGRSFADAFASVPCDGITAVLAECFARGRFTAFRET